ncbi:MAG: hypothetical protein ACT4PE_02900 [Candidatus Eiseniibacteriota bacterium]
MDDGLPEDPAPATIQTWAGNGFDGFNGDDKPLLKSALYTPIDVAFAQDGHPYIIDWNNDRIREVTASGIVVTIMGTDFPGDGPPDLSDLSQPGAIGTKILINHPTEMIELPDGTWLMTIWHNHKLRIWDPVTRMAYVYCGRGQGFAGDGAVVDAATRLNQVKSTVRASDGSYYILDQRNQRIRKVDPAGMITTVFGSPVDSDGDGWVDQAFAGDGGPPINALMNQPTGGNPLPGGTLVLDAQGRLYFSDTLNHRVRRIDFSLDLVDTVVGNGLAGFAGDGGPGTAASINNPRDITFGPDGMLYIADEWNQRVRRWDPSTGIITTVAGNGVPGYTGDGGHPLNASFNRPTGVTFEPVTGWLYITDSWNHVVRRVNMEGI